ALVEPERAAGDAIARGVVGIVVADPELAPELRDPRQEGNHPAVRQGVAFGATDPARAARLEKLPAQAALPDARLRDHADHPPRARDRVRERRLELARLLGAPDEAREAARARRIEARPDRPHALELVRPDGLAGALHGERAEVAQAEPAGDERRRVLRQVRPLRTRELLHARGETDRVALCRVVHAEIVADRADDDLARVHPQADREAEAERPLQLLAVAAEAIGEVERGMAGAPGVVLVRDRRAEERHDPVAGELVDRPLEA